MATFLNTIKYNNIKINVYKIVLKYIDNTITLQYNYNIKINGRLYWYCFRGVENDIWVL